MVNVQTTGSVAGKPLVLGGHSFISQLGNDPPASKHEQLRIVETCLDHGIVWLDTTYLPERVALGKALETLGRRQEARILAWNFFTDFSPGDPVGEAEYYLPGHIDRILEELHTDYVDCLVAVHLNDPELNQAQEELLIEWRKRGYTRCLGLWAADVADLERHRVDNPFRFAIRPFNITTSNAAPAFAVCKKLGFETIATSPFFRGWELDRMVTEAEARGYGDRDMLSGLLSDLMLRFTLFQPDVDRVIVAMRKISWIFRNLDSIARGPLTAEEDCWLRQLQVPVGKTPWWRRLRRAR